MPYMYVCPLFDIANMTNYADDNYVIRWNKCLTALIADMEKSLEAITKWLKKSGLKVNEEKTELCLFHRMDKDTVQMRISNTIITSKPNINVCTRNIIRF
jgi:dsDNA-binding SOS-regulon protein